MKIESILNTAYFEIRNMVCVCVCVSMGTFEFVERYYVAQKKICWKKFCFEVRNMVCVFLRERLNFSNVTTKYKKKLAEKIMRVHARPSIRLEPCSVNIW